MQLMQPVQVNHRFQLLTRHALNPRLPSVKPSEYLVHKFGSFAFNPVLDWIGAMDGTII